jgi:hypothetical protein
MKIKYFSLSELITDGNEPVFAPRKRRSKMRWGKLCLVILLLTMFSFYGKTGESFAAQPSAVVEQIPRSHDADAVIQRRMRRPTPEQRAAAAANLRAAREAADPAIAARKIVARKASARSAEARMAALRDPATSATAPETTTKRAKRAVHRKAIRDAAASEAAARQLAASATASSDVKTMGGTNE